MCHRGGGRSSGRPRRSRLNALLVVTVSLLSVLPSTPVGAEVGPSISAIAFEEEVRTGGEQVVTFAIDGAAPSNISSVGVRWDAVSRDGGGLDASAYENWVPVDPNEDGEYVVTFGAPLDEGRVYFIVYARIDGEDHFGHDREFSFDVTEPPALELGLGFLIAMLVIIVLAGLAMFALWLRSKGMEEKG